MGGARNVKGYRAIFVTPGGRHSKIRSGFTQVTTLEVFDMGQKTMKNTLIALFLMIIGISVVSTQVFAHHGTGISYDQDSQISLKGTVTEFVWRNPHAQLWLDVSEGDFKGQSFGIEMNSPGVMLRWGWTKNTFKNGDEITVKVHPSRTGKASANA